MNLNAYKMNGLGNDFVILDNRDNSINLSKDQIIKISDRKFIGCDQLIIINQIMENNKMDNKKKQIKYNIYLFYL